MKTEIYTTEDVFTDLQAEWLDLLSRSVTNYVFQSPQFQGAWWKTLGEGELRVVVVRTDEGKLVGLAPLFLSKTESNKSQVCFIGCVNVSDYLDFLVDTHHVEEVYGAFKNALTSEIKEWNSIYLCSLPAASPTRNWLKENFKNATEKQQDVSPSIQLPSSWEEYLSCLDRKQRHEIKRKMRRVSEVDHTYELVTTQIDAQSALNDFIALHKASSAEKRDFWDDNHLKFFSEFIPAAGKTGWLKLYFLKIGNIRAAAMLVFDYNNQYLLYNSGFDPSQFKQLSTGNVLTAHTIKMAIEEKKSVYDFLRGDEEYKFRFGAEAHPVFDISVIK